MLLLFWYSPRRAIWLIHRVCLNIINHFTCSFAPTLTYGCLVACPITLLESLYEVMHVRSLNTLMVRDKFLTLEVRSRVSFVSFKNHWMIKDDLDLGLRIRVKLSPYIGAESLHVQTGRLHRYVALLCRRPVQSLGERFNVLSEPTSANPTSRFSVSFSELN